MTAGILASQNIKKVHFIGIGGISMSGLAEILLHLGYAISGSDMKASPTTEKLIKQNILFYTPQAAENIKDPDLVVYTAAIAMDNPELQKAQSLGIPCIDRATLLGEIMQNYKISIACAGTHGKTTTTAMVTSILLAAQTDPTAHIGGVLPFIGNSTRIGKNDYFITEACEYVESFHKFYPTLAVLLNIEADHLDYFSGLESIKQSFVRFTQNVASDGALIVNLDDENIQSILAEIERPIISFGISHPMADWQARDISFDAFGCASFSVMHQGQERAQVSLAIPGLHNVSNALAAIAVCYRAFPALSSESIQQAFGMFKGAARRYELKGFVDGIRVVDDYAHHPTEIKATLSAAREGQQNQIWCVFQPHTYTRTKALLASFSTAFDAAHHIIITDIYAAREKDPGDIHATMLVNKLCEQGKLVSYIPDFTDIVNHLDSHAQPGDLILTMGAGNIHEVAELFVQRRFEKALQN